MALQFQEASWLVRMVQTVAVRMNDWIGFLKLTYAVFEVRNQLLGSEKAQLNFIPVDMLVGEVELGKDE